MKTTNIKGFLETYDLYQRFLPRNGTWWNGEWPETVEVACRACRVPRVHTVFASKVAGLSTGWGVYMIQGACSTCYNDGLMFWVEVNYREGWMQKAGQLPGIAVHVAALARPA
jgi:hypothetical protein